MKKDECLGCQTSFEANQKLTLEHLTIEHKNYQLPLKDSKHKWILLKTIVSFLNSKGGTIYIGVQDKQGEVKGQRLERKQRDQFRLSIKHLLQRIHPKVDIEHKEEVKVQYVPIFNRKEFEGKYLTKIIVHQGEPSKTYLFSEKIKLEGPNRQTEEFQNFNGFFRHNMGGIDRIFGLKLLEGIYQKATHPNPIANTFHEGCNPQPPHLELQVDKICFLNIDAKKQEGIQSIFSAKLEQLKTSYEIKYVAEKKSVFIEIEDDKERQEVLDYVNINIQFFNQAMKLNFKKKGIIGSSYVYENSEKQQGTPKPESKKEKKKEEYSKEKHEEKSNPPIKKQEEKKQSKNSERKISNEVQQPKKVLKQSQNFTKKYSLTFTHINPKVSSQLINYLENNIYKNMEKSISIYVNTMEVFFRSGEDRQKYYNKMCQVQHAILSYGFNNEMFVGINTGILKILNYNSKKRDELVNYLKSIMKGDLKEIGFEKDKSRFYLGCTFGDKAKACQWLDALLINREVKKNFRIPGSENGTSAKMKFILHVIV